MPALFQSIRSAGVLARKSLVGPGFEVGRFSSYHEALGDAGNTDREEIAAALLERALGSRDDSALLAVIAAGELVSDEVHETASRVAGERWGELIPELEVLVGPLGAATAARRHAHWTMAGWFAKTIVERDQASREVAAKGLLRLARLASRLDREGRAAIEKAVGVAADAFDVHRERRVLASIAIVLDRPNRIRLCAPELQRVVLDERHPMHGSLKSVIRRIDDVGVDAGSWSLLGVGHLSGACADRLIRAKHRDEETFGAQLRSWIMRDHHLLSSPVRMRAFSLLGRQDRRVVGRGLLPNVDEVMMMSSAERLGLAHWIARAPVADQVKETTIVVALTDVDPRVRLMAMEHGRRVLDGRVFDDLCFDDAPRIAQHAAFVMRSALRRSRDTDRTRLMRTLLGSPQATVRRIARGAVGGSSLWDVTDARARLFAREWAQRDEASFVREARAAIRSGDARGDAIKMVDRLGRAGAVELELVAIVGSAVGAERTGSATGVDQALVEAALSALGRVETDGATRAIRAASMAADGSFRLAAARGVVRRNSKLQDEVLGVLERDDDAQVRAGVARNLLARDRARGVQIVSAMLVEDRAAHREAAVGLVAQERGWSHSILVRVDDLARSDESLAVREVARGVSGRLAASERARWRGGLASPTVVSHRTPGIG